MLRINRTYDGFKVIEKHKLKKKGEYAYVLEHCKTKGKILYYDCDSKELSCCIAFRTPVRDNRGLPHIIEHSVLQGSKKYFLPNRFFGLCAISLSDDINAYTANDHTAYHFSTRNHKDFKMIFSYYIAAVYQPLFLEDEKIFLREGWHFEKLSDGKVDCSGIVYNEMKEWALNTKQIEGRSALKLLFPGTSLEYEAGGDITYIPSSNWEAVKKFYKAYYHPSNNVITFYGRIDILKYLKIINEEYFSKYSFRKYNFKNIKTEVRGIRKLECVKPVTKSPYIEKEKSDVWVCYAKHENINTLDGILIDVFLQYALSHNEHNIRWKLITNDAVSDLDIFLDNYLAGGCYGFVLKGVEKDKLKSACNKLIEYLKECRQEGLDYRSLKRIIKLLKRYYFSKEAHDICIKSTRELIYGMDPFDMSAEEAFAFIEDKIDNDLDYLSERLNEFMLNTAECGILFVYPDKGYKKALVNEMNGIINQKFSKLKKEEKALVQKISETLASTVYEKVESSEKLPVLKREDLDFDLNWNESKEIEVLGKKINVYMIPDTNDVHMEFTFDISNLSKRETTLLKVMADYLFYCYTKKRTYLKTYDDAIYAFKDYEANFSYTNEDNKLKRWLKIKIEFERNDMKEALELISDVFTNTVYKPSLTYGMLYWSYKDHYELISKEPHKVAIRTSQSKYSKKANFEVSTSGIIAANYLVELMLESQSKEGSIKLCEKCKDIFGRVFNFSRMSVVVACSNEKLANEFGKIMNNEFAKFPRELSQRDSLHVPVTFKFEPSYSAATFNTIVQYNALSIDVREYMKDFKGSPELVETYLEEWVIINFVRVFGNAYGGRVKYEDGIFTFYSYRDPVVEETLDVFINAASMLMRIGIHDLEAHKVSVAWKKMGDACEFEKILAIEEYKKSGMTEEDVKNEINEIFETTEEQILECCKEILKAASEQKYDYYIVGDYELLKNSREGLLKTITIY